ncbi:hypothetical protein [Alkalibacterium olivapovliticus]|uniref:Uncharacterized protein n=1 Tax=Alkalibacterium olivapovliticus TaxID=99907 RepID=A0A2T0W735_9LACT|nr:hypothetical protein [Alkalibacterium olivapovliticus]PRY82518.1 hypothetical protein CLV38_11168 [Alkalibacterium olivapovliticus]
MSFYENIKNFIKNNTSRSDQLIQSKSLKENKHGRTLSIQYKLQVFASELTTNQEIIDSIIKKIIKKDNTKRSFAGKSDEELTAYPNKIYRYESYQTNRVKLVPSQSNRLEVFVDNIYLGELPEHYTKNALHYLQSTIIMSFAYINGGPYKQWNDQKKQIEHGIDPYDLTIYIQFS